MRAGSVPQISSTRGFMNSVTLTTWSGRVRSSARIRAARSERVFRSATRMVSSKLIQSARPCAVSRVRRSSPARVGLARERSRPRARGTARRTPRPGSRCSRAAAIRSTGSQAPRERCRSAWPAARAARRPRELAALETSRFDVLVAGTDVARDLAAARAAAAPASNAARFASTDFAVGPDGRTIGLVSERQDGGAGHGAQQHGADECARLLGDRRHVEGDDRLWRCARPRRRAGPRRRGRRRAPTFRRSCRRGASTRSASFDPRVTKPRSTARAASSASAATTMSTSPGLGISAMTGRRPSPGSADSGKNSR